LSQSSGAIDINQAISRDENLHFDGLNDEEFDIPF
jgi:hypothetical protein